MSKIICDICGTTYPDTAEQCPICGCPRDAALDLLGDDLLLDSAEERADVLPQRRKKKYLILTR